MLAELILLVVNNIFIFLFGLVLVIVFIIILSRKIKYDDVSIDIKEAPIEVNDILRDGIKRGILRSIKKEKKFISRMAREIGHDPAKIRFHLKRLESFSLVSQFKLARETYFKLTERGLWCLKAIDYYYPEIVFNKVIAKILRKKPGKFPQEK